MLGALFVMPSCTVMFDTSLDGASADGGRNACGGLEALRFEGSPAEIGDRCGPCGGGFLVCNGIDALRCVGAAEENACGGCSPLEAQPNDPCGFCGDGYFTCNGDNDVACTYASFPNGCGGCTELGGAPGFPCSRPGGADGTWVCEGTTGLDCRSGDLNACGGIVQLQYNGSISAPGQPCAGTCGDGVLVCDGADRLMCRGAEQANACGGCSILPGEPGGSCGPCGDGTWECTDDGDLACAADPPNACGGCVDFSGNAAPGSACDGGTAICNTATTTVCATLGADTNACGGIGTLEGQPGEACGTCDSGIWTCADVAHVVCEGDGGEAARNGCGGCAGLDGVPGARCGACGSGTWACDGTEAVVCQDDLGDLSANACGGCGRLWGTVGASCANCYYFDCLGAGERLQCVYATPEDVLAGDCGPPPSCEEQRCEALNRECLVDDAGRPYCGACIEGFVNLGDECVGVRCQTVDDCPTVAAGAWSECVSDDPPCGTAGTRTRAGRTADCIDGVCQLQTDRIREDCIAPTDGLSVSNSPVGVCTADADVECPLVGKQAWTETYCQGGGIAERRVEKDCVFDPSGRPCGTGGRCTPTGECEGGSSGATLGSTCVAASDCSSGNCSRGVCAPPGMVTVFGGTFTMGSAGLDALTDESPEHRVTLSRDFFVGATEVTVGQFEAVLGTSSGERPELPVTNVRWIDAVAFCNALSTASRLTQCYQLSGTTGLHEYDPNCSGFRLLTEAEYEYVLRAGTNSPYFCGTLPTCLRDHAVYAGAASGGVQPVQGSRRPNPWGLYDIVGNAAEWVWDQYDPRYYSRSPATDPAGPDDGSGRVIRGGSYASSSLELRSSARASAAATTRSGEIGFRIARNRPGR